MKWLTTQMVEGIHKYSLSQHGGGEGTRDQNLLESAVHRPQDQDYYEDPSPSVWELAATYCHAIGKNHPFIDGNKRTAITAALVFLRINGHGSKVPEADGVIQVLALITDEISIKDFAQWLEEVAV